PGGVQAQVVAALGTEFRTGLRGLSGAAGVWRGGAAGLGPQQTGRDSTGGGPGGAERGDLAGAGEPGPGRHPRPPPVGGGAGARGEAFTGSAQHIAFPGDRAGRAPYGSLWRAHRPATAPAAEPAGVSSGVPGPLGFAVDAGLYGGTNRHGVALPVGFTVE